MRTRRPCPAPSARSVFAGFRFPPDVIVLAVRWYLRYGLSYRDVEELLVERGVEVDHVTVYRWVLRFTPLLAEAARPCRHAVGDRWQVDETYVKVAGEWRYVYRAIDQFSQVVDVFVSTRRDADAAERFFKRAIGATGVRPVEVTTDRASVYPAVLEALLPASRIFGAGITSWRLRSWRLDGEPSCSTSWSQRCDAGEWRGFSALGRLNATAPARTGTGVDTVAVAPKCLTHADIGI
jgi:transposase-like protein